MERNTNCPSPSGRGLLCQGFIPWGEGLIPMLRLYNSYTKKKQAFKPLKNRRVAMYNCGPTVYDFVHIGNLRSFLFADILRRYLGYSGYKVKQIMNITDVGHMTTDADAGEDKMSVAAKREGKRPIEVARFY